MINQLPATFTNKIDYGSDCWIWLGARDRDGYGQYHNGPKMVKAHRFSWSFLNGEIPKGILVCHKCDVSSCVNPLHLFLGTSRENSKDMMEKGRAASGEGNGNSKISLESAIEIRKSYKRGTKGEFSLRGLSKKYGVSYVQIGRIVNQKLWNRSITEVTADISEGVE